MKSIIILGDGMSDEPIEELRGKTPLQYANTPNMDYLAKNGICGELVTVPEGFAPGSEIANMVILGYDPRKEFEGRGSLEAASMGVEIGEGEMAMRCNILTVENGLIKNHSAGHISDHEAHILIKYLDENLGNERVSFHSGVSYRHLLKIKNGNKNIATTPPHDVPGTPFKDVMVKPLSDDAKETAELLNSLILRSQEILASHPVNLKRISEGKEPANSIWPWSPGYRPKMKTMMEKYGIKNGAVISAVDLVRGIGVYAGLKPILVEGATGLYNTNYEGKAKAAIEALKTNDFVYLHVEATDEAGHEGDVDLKIKTIEYLDKRIIEPIINELKTWNEPVRIALLPDHPTPCKLRTHTSKPVPFVIYDPTVKGDDVQSYDEFTVKKGGYKTLHEKEFIKELLKK